MRLPEILKSPSLETILEDNNVIQGLLDYYCETIFKIICSGKRSGRIHEKALSVEWKKFDEDGKIVKLHIRLCRRAARSKELVCLAVLHKIAHFVTSGCNHNYHGNAYLKVLEQLYSWDPLADLYVPSRWG